MRRRNAQVGVDTGLHLGHRVPQVGYADMKSNEYPADLSTADIRRMDDEIPQTNYSVPRSRGVLPIRQIVREAQEDPIGRRNASIREQVVKERHPTTLRGRIGQTLTTAQQIANLPMAGQLPDVLRNEDDAVGEETNRRIEQADRANTPEMIQARKKFGALDPVTRTAASIPATLYSDVLKGGAGAIETTDLLSGGGLSKVVSLIGVDARQIQDYLNQKGNLFKESQQMPLTAEGEDVKRSLIEKLGSTVGEMSVGIGELMLLKKSTGLSMAKIMALETALKTSDQPVRVRAKAVAVATAMGKVLDGHLSRTSSAALFGAPTAVQSGTEVVKGNMEPLEAVLQTGLQAGTGFALGGKPAPRGETSLTRVPDIDATIAAREARVGPPVRANDARINDALARELQRVGVVNEKPSELTEPQPSLPQSSPLDQAIQQRANVRDRISTLEKELSQWRRAGGRGRGGQQRIRAIENELSQLRGTVAQEDQAAAQKLASEQRSAIEQTRYSPTPRFDEWVENESGQRASQLAPEELATLRQRYQAEFANAPAPPALREMPPLQEGINENETANETQSTKAKSEQPATQQSVSPSAKGDGIRESATAATSEQATSVGSGLGTEPPHHSQSQNRRVRNTATGKRGQFAKGKLVEPSAEGNPNDVTDSSLTPPATKSKAEGVERSVPSLPTESSLPQGQRATPLTLERAGLEGGTDRTYDVVTNEASIKKANDTIERLGVDDAVDAVKFADGADKTALGITLIKKLQDAGKHDQAVDVASDLARELTKQGQAIQAVAIVNRLAPERVVIAAEQMVSKHTNGNGHLKAETGKKIHTEATKLKEAEARIESANDEIAKLQTKQPKAKILTLQERLAKVEADARARIAERQAKIDAGELEFRAAGPTPSPHFNDYVIIGAAKLAQRGVSFASWSRDMVADFGEQIKPQLRAIYQQSFSKYRDEQRQMQRESQERGATKEATAAGIPITDKKQLDDLIAQRIQARKDAASSRRELAKIFQSLTQSRWQRAKGIAVDTLSVPRALKSSIDLSAPRQASMWMLSHPVEGAKLFFGKQLKAMREVNYDKFVDQLESDPDYQLMRRSGLSLASVAKDRDPFNITAREEAFASRLAGKIPGVSHSERAYTTFIDTARSSWFKQLARQAESVAKAKGSTVTPEQYQAIANFVNVGTGRGNLGRGQLSKISPFLNAVFFAPRYAASKVQVFDPRVYSRLPPGARASAMKSAVGYFGAMATTALILKYGMGQDVSLDPESSEFMKLKEGNTRYDLTFGQGQYFVLASRLLRNAENKRTGKKDDFGKSAMENVDRFLRYKYSPPAAMARNLWEGKDAVGQPTSLKKESIEAITPLFLNDLYQAYQQEGAKGIAKTAPGFMGVGVNTYNADKSRTGSDGRPTRPTRQSTPRPTRTPLQRMGIFR
jgi:hypothetical protein